MRKLRDYIENLNAYSRATTNEHKKRTEILSTRFYLLLLIISLILYSTYEILIEETVLIQIYEPKLIEYEKYENRSLNNFQCPCKDISIPFQSFVNIEIDFHEICSSDFISQQWIEYLFNENLNFSFHKNDIRYSGFAQFEILQILCQYASDTINENLNEFYSNEYLTENLISKDDFPIEISHSIEIFKANMLKFFQDPIELFRLIVQNERIFSAVDTKYSFFIRDYYFQNEFTIAILPIQYRETNYTFDCYQSSHQINRIPSGIHLNSSLFLHLSGLVIGCLPIESLFHSTLECFYNQTCLDLIRHSIDSSKTFSILRKPSNFSRETTFENLTKQMFIEEIRINQSYSTYFQQCQPLLCQFNQKQKQDFLEIFTSIVSFYGGLTVILHFLVRYLVGKLRKTRQGQTNEAQSFKQRLDTLIRNAMNLIKTFNKFNSYSTDENIRRKEMYLTRFYLLILIISLTIYFCYSLINIEMKLITKSRPTKSQFNQIFKQIDRDNLYCPCERISIKYSKLIEIQNEIHSICSSIFVSDIWLETNYWSEAHRGFQRYDFRYVIHNYFNFLSRFCQMTNETIELELKRFYSKTYLTKQLISEDDFHGDFQRNFHLFQLNFKESFKFNLKLIEHLISFNHLVSTLDTNGILILVSNQLRVYTRVYSDCFCVRDRSCEVFLGFALHFYLEESVDGMSIGCFILDSLFNSHVKCFFDSQCILQIKSYMNANTRLYPLVQPLNSSHSSNVTFRHLIEEFFIENWTLKFNYSNYFRECQPKYCQYNVEKRSNVLLVLTEIIAVYGGLTLILKIIAKLTLEILGTARSTDERTNRMVSFVKNVRRKFVDFNLFPTSSPNRLLIRYERIITRIYLLLFFSAFTFCFSQSFKENLVRKQLQLTDLNDFQLAEQKYSPNLTCSCSKISIEYREFLSANVTFDELCSSNWLKKDFIDFLFLINHRQRDDYYSLLSNHFSVLKFLCQFSRETFRTRVELFLSEEFVNKHLLNEKTFNDETDLILKKFQRTILIDFQKKFHFILNLISANQFVSFYELNWKFRITTLRELSPILVDRNHRFNSTCNCITNRNCSQILHKTDEYPDGLPSLYLSCSPIESLLKSSFICLNDSNCLKSLIESIDNSSKLFDEYLFENLNSKFIDRTVEQLIEQMFITDWNLTKSYSKYFRECDSRTCIYLLNQRFQILNLLKIFFGLTAGFTSLFKILIPFVFHLFLFLSQQRSTPVQPFA